LQDLGSSLFHREKEGGNLGYRSHMASGIGSKSFLGQNGTWKLELLKDDQVKLTEPNGTAHNYSFEVVQFSDKGAIYEFGKYCRFQGKSPGYVLNKVKDIGLNSPGAGLPVRLTLYTSKMQWGNK